MADREREKKKKRAYLDDFEKDLNGNYQYRGAHYRYAGGHPTAGCWLCCGCFCGGGAALTVGAGALPGPRPTHLCTCCCPYMAALVLALYAVVLLVRLTRGGARVRAYIHEQTAQKLPSLCRATAVLCAAASAGQGVAAFAADAQLLWGMQGVFILFELLSCAAFAAAAWLPQADAVGKRRIIIHYHNRACSAEKRRARFFFR